jgi:hypothetical protein
MPEDSKAEAMAEEVKAEAATEAVEGKAPDEASKAAKAPEVEAHADGEAVKDGAAAESVPTLRQIFSLPEKETDPSDENWKAFRKKVKKEVKGIKWIASMPDLAPKVCELLNIKVPDLLISAWKKVQDIQRVLAESRNTPDKTVYLELAEHSIDHNSKPSIDVKIKNATVKKLELPIQLGFKLKGFVLKVQNGRIKEIQTGHCEAKGAIKYGTLTIAEKKLEPIRLPLSIKIPDEIPFLTPDPADADERPEEKPEANPAVPAPVEPLERIEL